MLDNLLSVLFCINRFVFLYTPPYISQKRPEIYHLKSNFFLFLPVNASQACRQLTSCGFMMCHTLAAMPVPRAILCTRAIYVIMRTGHGGLYYFLWKMLVSLDQMEDEFDSSCTGESL